MELAKINNNSPDAHSVSLPIPVSGGAFSLEKTIMTIGRKNDNEVTVNVVTTGSEKQIKWANSIKCNLIVNLLGWMDQPDMKKCHGRFKAVIDGLNTITDSKTLIDNRAMSNKDVIRWIEGIV